LVVAIEIIIFLAPFRYAFLVWAVIEVLLSAGFVIKQCTYNISLEKLKWLPRIVRTILQSFAL
jgi:uncharacterized membrane protein YqaE (UPF0057 family)